MKVDVLVVGAGIAGASAAFELLAAAPSARIALVERESVAGWHSTGRSAALFLETYGGPAVRALAAASRRFLEQPPAGFAEHPILSPRGVLHVAGADQVERLARLYAEWRERTPGIRWLEAGAIAALQPAIRPGHAAAAVHEPGAMDVDVGALLQGYLRGFRAGGGTLVTGAAVTGIERRRGRWRLAAGSETFEATTLVNAAGAWADEIAGLAGLAASGLVPMRRTVILFDPPEGVDPRPWPMTVAADEAFYFKPEGGRILASPADETPVPASDVQPDEWDVAVAAHRIETATTLPVRRIVRRWAGLRSFYADRMPAVGWDPRAPGFVWLAGQGGYGIVTAPALSRLVAALVTGGEAPADLALRGITADALSPARLPALAAGPDRP